MTSLGLFCKKMLKLQSPRMQCCLCVCCVLTAVLGMAMLSVGVCLVLNYNLMDVDTSGLPPNLHNDEGKKVVGIILIVMGVVSVIVSGVVSTLYFTVCTRYTPGTSVTPRDHSHSSSPREAQDKEKASHDRDRPASDRNPRPAPTDKPFRPSSRENQPHLMVNPHYKHLHGNGTGRSSPVMSGARRPAALQYGRSVSDPMNRSLVSPAKDGAAFPSRGGAIPRSSHSSSASRPQRRGKKGRHPQGRRYKNPLEPHPEEAGAESQSLSESRRSASSSRRLQGQVNYGADLEEDLEMTQGSVASGSSGSSSYANPSVIIKVDSSHVGGEGSPSRERSAPGEQETDLTLDPEYRNDRTAGRNNDDDREDDDDDVGEEDESGRMSQSTLGSQELLDEDADEDPGAAKQRLDNQIQELLS